MKTREEAEQRANELYPPNCGGMTSEAFNKQARDAYLQCWGDMQVANEARQAADEVDNDKMRGSIKDNSQICGFCVKRKEQ